MDNANVGKNESYHTRISIIRVFFYFIQGREKPMREYKTQMEAARKGIVTEELKKVYTGKIISVNKFPNCFYIF